MNGSFEEDMQLGQITFLTKLVGLGRTFRRRYSSRGRMDTDYCTPAWLMTPGPTPLRMFPGLRVTHHDVAREVQLWGLAANASDRDSNNEQQMNSVALGCFK